MNENSVSQLVERIDNLVCHKIAYMYKKLNRHDSAYFSGILDAYYWFAYNLADDTFGHATIQDCIDFAYDDILACRDKARYSAYHKGVWHASRELIDMLSTYKEWYYNDMYGDYPIKHIYSTLNVFNFDINMQW